MFFEKFNSGTRLYQSDPFFKHVITTGFFIYTVVINTNFLILVPLVFPGLPLTLIRPLYFHPGPQRYIFYSQFYFLFFPMFLFSMFLLARSNITFDALELDDEKMRRGVDRYCVFAIGRGQNSKLIFIVKFSGRNVMKCFIVP